jgi:hypothetical protein
MTVSAPAALARALNHLRPANSEVSNHAARRYDQCTLHSIGLCRWVPHDGHRRLWEGSSQPSDERLPVVAYC